MEEAFTMRASTPFLHIYCLMIICLSSHECRPAAFIFPSRGLGGTRTLCTQRLKDDSFRSFDNVDASHPTCKLRFTRRMAMAQSLLVTCLMPTLQHATAVESSTNTLYSLSLNVESLKCERILGKGTYKTVYLVLDTTATEGELNERFYAMAVEPVRTKSQVKEGLRGIHIAEYLESQIQSHNDEKYFEQILDWWFQPVPPVVVNDGKGAEEFALRLPKDKQPRAKTSPSRFLGTQWLVALKPVYEMDLKSFIRKHPTLYPVVASPTKQSKSRLLDDEVMPLTETAVLNFVRDLCHAGTLMHETGLVHRDIKPKNIMLSLHPHPGGIHPVIIDFGFSRLGNRQESSGKGEEDNDICIVEPGRVRGEVGYVLAQDVALYRGCQTGDVYAMGKTLYEFLFLEAPVPADATQEEHGVSAKRAITEPTAQEENERFRALLFDPNAGAESRFHLSVKTRDFFVRLIQGLCREQGPISFQEAERLVLEFTQQRG